jgi:hypothetical protein
MTAGLWTPTNSARTKMINGQFDIDSDNYRVGLVGSASNIGLASTTWAGVTGEVAAGNGYATGGLPVALTITAGAVTAPSDAVWGAPSGYSVTITSATNGLPVLATGTMFQVREHSNPANEGLYFATGTPTAGSLPCIKVGSQPVAAASEAVSIKGPDLIKFAVNPAWTNPSGSGGNLVARWAVLYEVGGDVVAYVLLDATPADVPTTPNNTLTVVGDTASAYVLAAA